MTRLATRVLLSCALALPASILTAADAPADPPVTATATADWYCVGHDAAHTYTSDDRLPTPLKFLWSWHPAKGELLHAVSSGGKVFAHGRRTGPTPVGDRNGCHNYVIDLATGAFVSEDPGGTSANDWTFGHPIGTADGQIYQADDGGPMNGADVWSPMQVSPTEKFWAVIQQSKIDGPDPGIYCMGLGKYVGQGWYSGAKASGSGIFCTGDISIGTGSLFAAIRWAPTTTGPDAVSGLVCHELAGGKRTWKLDGKFIAVSAGAGWCAAVDERKVLVIVNAADGKVLATSDITGLPECPPMVVGDDIRIYDEQGGLTSFKLVEKDGKHSLKRTGQMALGKFDGPRVVGRYNSAFCFSADGTMYFASGGSVAGIPSTPKGKRWTWSVPPAMAKDLGPISHPIIARGKLIVVGKGGVLCFDTEGAKAKAPDPKK